MDALRHLLLNCFKKVLISLMENIKSVYKTMCYFFFFHKRIWKTLLKPMLLRYIIIINFLFSCKSIINNIDLLIKSNQCRTLKIQIYGVSKKRKRKKQNFQDLVKLTISNVRTRFLRGPLTFWAHAIEVLHNTICRVWAWEASRWPSGDARLWL